jgi:hypothetical protein
VKITQDNFVGFDCNVYEPVFQCECGYDGIYWDYKFCPMCGVELEIDDTLVFTEEQCAKMPKDFIETNEAK